MIIRRTLTLSTGLAAMLAAGAVLLAATGDAYAVTITHGGCHEVKTLMCPAGNGGRHPPPAEYMAAPERFAEKSDSSCTAGAVHTWPFATVHRGAAIRSLSEG